MGLAVLPLPCLAFPARPLPLHRDHEVPRNRTMPPTVM